MAAAKETGKTDKKWHAELMCKLSSMLREDELRNLKQVISMAEDVPQNEIEKCSDFFILWKTLERLGKIRLGEYGILIYYLELLHRQDCVLVIKDHITKIEEYRQGQECQPGPLKQTDELFDPRYRQMVDEMIHSKLQEFHKKQPTLPSSGAVGPSPLPLPTLPSSGAVGPSPLPLNPAKASQASTCVERAPASAKINQQDGPTLPSSGAVGPSPLPLNPAQTSQASTCAERAKINQQDGHGQTALTRAAEGFDIDDVRSLLKSGAYPDLPDVDGYTALMYASREGYWEIADALIENHADVNLQNKVEDDSTALMYASCNGHKECEEVVAVLLENNVDVNLQDTFGKTALSYAKREGHNKVVKMLMAAGARQ